MDRADKCVPRSSAYPSTDWMTSYTGELVKETIPVVKDWTVKDVYKYTYKYFGKKIADVVKFHAIDGEALLLLTYHQVISNADRHYQAYLKAKNPRKQVNNQRVPFCIKFQLYIHAFCLKYRVSAYEAFRVKLMRETKLRWTHYILPGDAPYTG